MRKTKRERKLILMRMAAALIKLISIKLGMTNSIFNSLICILMSCPTAKCISSCFSPSSYSATFSQLWLLVCFCGWCMYVTGLGVLGWGGGPLCLFRQNHHGL